MTLPSTHSQPAPPARPAIPAAVWAFALLTVTLSVAVLFLLPGLAGPAIVVFIPAVLATVILTRSAGWAQARRQLFSRAAWRVRLAWAAAAVGLAVALRLGVSALALVLVDGYAWQPAVIWPLLVATLLFAAAEEVGWRGFALPAMLARGFGPLTAALLLGLPWALLHLPLVLPGMLSAGTPPLAQFLSLLALSVLTAWVYLAGGRGLLAPTLLHAVQNFLSTLNSGLDPAASAWLMAAVYGAAALVVVVGTRGRLGDRL